MINRHIREHDVDLRLNTQLREIKANGKGQVSSVIIEETGEEILCDLVGLTVGVSPNIDFVKKSNILTGKGILVNRFLETNIPNIYAIGDCAEQKEPVGERKAIEAVWYTGRMMGETLAQTICKKKMAYHPDIGLILENFSILSIRRTAGYGPSPKKMKIDFIGNTKTELCVSI